MVRSAYCLLLGMLAATAHGTTTGVFRENAALPAIQLPTTSGQLTDIQPLLGKKIVLHVFASW